MIGPVSAPWAPPAYLPRYAVKCGRCGRPANVSGTEGQLITCDACGTSWVRPAQQAASEFDLSDTAIRLEAPADAVREMQAARGKLHATYGAAEVGGLRYNEGKPPLQLLDAYALEQCARVLAKGALKYAPNNWRRGLLIAEQIGCLLRHVFKFMIGEDRDEESGELHMAHAMVNCMFILWTMHARPDLDDRFKPIDVAVQK